MEKNTLFLECNITAVSNCSKAVAGLSIDHSHWWLISSLARPSHSSGSSGDISRQKHLIVDLPKPRRRSRAENACVL